MKRFLFIFLTFSFILINVNSQTIKSPDEFLGYELGTQFTFHSRAVDYFRYVAEKSPLADYREYGITNEGRTLGVCIVSSEDNLAHLEEYRKNNLIKAGVLDGEFTGKQIPIIWLGYNVHGNESAGMETAMKTLYTLVTGAYPGVEEWLKSCIIIIDPCQNPDGRDLYTNRFRSTMNLIANPGKNAWEHNQGWPNSRTNHYMFDLNRDWAWQTQAESSQRISLFHQFMPHVFADFHEMGPESSFFFAPGANPWHDVITPWQREFHRLIGNQNASLFDSKDRLYFTKDIYDLFCPSFGDTWPLFNGAIGCTYEQGGGGVAGLALKRESGDTLTLRKRIDGHFTASMATLKVAYENREKLITEFNRYFKDNAEKPSFQYKSIIVKGSNDQSNLNDLLELLKKSQIQYSYAGSIGKKFKGFDYLSDSNGEVTIEKGDLLVSAYQPESRLVQVMFEPKSMLSDTLTYDLTAWALPYVYNLKMYAVTDRIRPLDEKTETAAVSNEVRSDRPYGYVVNFSGFREIKFAASLQRKNIKIRYSLKPFTINGTNFNRGSFIITRGDNRNPDDRFDRIVTGEANRLQVKLTAVTTGLVDSGKDFGSEYSPLIKKNSVAVLCGNKSSSSSAGELWYFFEKELEYPVTLINTSSTEKFDLDGYDVLILSSGNYSALKDTIFNYVKNGGRVVALEDAISIFATDKTTSLYKAVEARNAELKATEKKENSSDTVYLKKFEDMNRYPLSENSSASIYKVKTDVTNPYAFGLGENWFIAKSGKGYPFLQAGNNIGYILDKDPVSGFAGYKFKKQIKNTMVIGSEKIGAGEVIYITDDPYYRAFWKSGRVLLANIIFR